MAPTPYENLVVNFIDDIIIIYNARLLRLCLTTKPRIFKMYYLLILKLGIINKINNLKKYVGTNNRNSGFSNSFISYC